jgi:drug/metabolite transporter (DMT)-like permease
VVLVPAFEYMFFRARFGSRVLGGILLSFVGLALLAMGEPPVAAAGRDVLKGDLLVLGCAVCFAFHILALARYGQSEDAIALAAWQTLVVVVVALPAHMAFESWSWPSHQVWGVIAFLALVATAAVTVMQISFQRHVTATQAALIFALEPVFASIFAWLMQGEILPLAGLSGSVAMLAGALAASWPSRQN